MKKHAPATTRNREPILAVLRDVFPGQRGAGSREGVVLEIASGSGEHAVFFAGAFPHLEWQPSDVDPSARESIAAHRDEAGLPNLRAPVTLDVTRPGDWSVGPIDAMLCCNMIHIAPWAACEGLLEGAARWLRPGAPLVMYGPFLLADRVTAPSNEAFDASLRARDPAWGIRHLDEVTARAAAAGLRFEQRVDMPANNLCVIFRAADPAGQ